MNIFKYKEYLQGKIDEKEQGKYHVYNERNLDSALIGDVILTARSGPLYASSSQIPYEITIISDDPESAIDFFTELFTELNNKVFTVINDNGDGTSSLLQVRQTYQSPTVMDPDLSLGSNHYARIVAFSTLFVSINVNDIKSISIDNEELEIEDGSISYVTETHSVKRSGNITVKSRIRTNTTSISFRMVNRNSIFCNKLMKIMFHLLDAETTFAVKVTLTNGIVGNFSMVLSQNVLNTAKAMLPGINVSLIELDPGE